MYLYINDRGGSIENAQRSNLNNNKKSMTVTMMTGYVHIKVIIDIVIEFVISLLLPQFRHYFHKLFSL